MVSPPPGADRGADMNNEPAEITQYDAALYIGKCKDLQELSELNTLLVARMKTLRARAGREIAASLAVGDFVRFIDTIKPTYLQGRRARVVEFRQTKLTVELLDGPIGKFRSGKIIVPPSCLKKIDPPRSFTTVDEDELAEIGKRITTAISDSIEGK